jgi:enoyl-CoA hydratase
MDKDLKDVTIAVSGPVAQITLNRPETFNAINIAFHEELTTAFRRVIETPDVRAIVFASTGKVFSAGGDFDLVLKDQADAVSRRHSMKHARTLFMAIADCPLPVVTALHGDCIGLGTSLVLCTDAIVAARTARISDPHIVIGLAAGDGGGVVWPQSAGLLLAKRYLLTGDRIPAETALAMGLVTDLVDTAAEALPAARKLAERIAALPPLAVQATKKMLNQSMRHRVEETFDYGLALENETMATEDVIEAIAAFREKRPPNYRGR